MIRIGLLLLTVFMLPSCTVYQSIGHNFGSFVVAPNGQDFQPVGYRWDYEHTALVYVYRPASTWADDELEAPSLYLNDEHLFNIRGNGYTWYELKPGNHEMLVRRPLMGLEGVKVGDAVDFTLKMVTELQLNAKAGQVYYLRYSEVDKDAAKFAESAHLYFDQALKCFRWRFRVGGQPFLSKPMTPAKGTLTKSHFVALATRA